MGILLNELYFLGMCIGEREVMQIRMHFLMGIFNFKYHMFGRSDDLYYPYLILADEFFFFFFL